MRGIRLRPSGLVATVSVALASLLLPAGPPVDVADASGRFSFSKPERCFMRKINLQRRAKGLRSLAWDRDLGYVARRHARQIGAERSLRHDYNYGTEITGWRRLGQNTGRGGGCDSLFAAFMRSSSHRHNILGRWRFMGVGVQRAGGRMYVQQVFEWKANPGNVYGTG